MKRSLIPILFLLIPLSLAGQARAGWDTVNIMRIRVMGSDTLLVSSIPEIIIYGSRPEPEWESWRYRRLIRNVKASLPYARIAGEQLKDLDQRLASMQNERQKKQFVDETEDKLRTQFEDQLKALTVTQGRILIKLVYRETGSTTYDCIQDVKGNFSAGFWQAVARLFGSSLKSVYDPVNNEEDRNIEMIISMIDQGKL
jgi:hypothetical protein